MFNNPYRLVLLVCTIYLIVGLELTGSTLLNVTPTPAFWVVFAQILLGCAMVAIKDPSFGRGYLFAAAMSIALLAIAAVAFAFNVVLAIETFFAAFMCPVTMFIVYQIRTKFNHRRGIRKSSAWLRRVTEFDDLQPNGR